MLLIISSADLLCYPHFTAVDTTPSGKGVGILSTMMAPGLVQRVALSRLSVRFVDDGGREGSMRQGHMPRAHSCKMLDPLFHPGVPGFKVQLPLSICNPRLKRMSG